MLRRLRCHLIAIIDLIRYRVYVPHIYEVVEEHRGNIFATDTEFRETNSLEHSQNEKFHADVLIQTCRCIRCGKEERTWIDDRGWKDGKKHYTDTH